MYKNQQKIVTAEETLGVVSHMIWGSEYYQVMFFVDGKPDGNNVPFSVTTYGSRNSEVSDGTKTGKNAPDKVANIFDLEGSRIEWTQNANDARFRGTMGRPFLP